MTALLLGIVVGAVLGLTGAGGGILAVPALVFGLGWALPQAAPVALLAVAGAAFIGAIEGFRRGLVRYRAAALMAVAGMVVTPLGVQVARMAPENVLLLLFAAAMAIVAARMYRQSARGAAIPATAPGSQAACHVDPATGRLHWTWTTAFALTAIGIASGFLTGLLGVGGGFLIVPALRHVSNITMQGIVATSLAVIAVVAGTAVAVAALHGQPLPLTIAAPFAAGSALGMVGGRIAGHRLDASQLQRLFAGVTAVVAVMLVARALRLVG